MKIDYERAQNREAEVRQHQDSRSIVKLTKDGEDNNQDHMLKLKDRHVEYQVVIHNLTNAEN